MVCKKCGKEFDEELLGCPYCGETKSSEVVLVTENKENLKENKKYLRDLKQINRKYKMLQRYRVKANFYTCIFVLVLLVVGLCAGVKIYDRARSAYQSDINKIAQEEKNTFAKYEKEFANKVLVNRDEKAMSYIVPSTDSSKINDYIASLYRHSESKIEEGLFMDKSYYLVTDYIMLDKYNLSDTTNNSIYPGAIIKGDSLFTDNYTVLATERKPIDLMSNQENGNPITIADPTYSNVTTALNQYANEYKGDVSKEWTYHLYSASTSQELNVVLGLDLGKSIDFNLGHDTNNKQTTMAVVYSQIYYTVSAEPQKSASSYFEEGVDVKVLGGYEPAYVSSVDYGRKIVLIVSGNLSEKELSAKLDGYIKGVGIGIGIENVIKDESLECSLMSYGGEDISEILNTSNKNTGLVGELRTWFWDAENSSNDESIGDRLNTFLSSDNTLINPVPISYCLKYLSDNASVPAMYINSQTIMLAENAQLVNLSSTDNKEFSLDISSLPGIILNEKEVLLQDGKAMGTNFQLLCSDCETLPLSISYKNVDIFIDLAEYKMEKETQVLVNDPWRWKFLEPNGIIIYKTQYLEHIQ